MTYFMCNVDDQSQAGDHDQRQDFEDQKPVDRFLFLDGRQAWGQVRGARTRYGGNQLDLIETGYLVKFRNAITAFVRIHVAFLATRDVFVEDWMRRTIVMRALPGSGRRVAAVTGHAGHRRFADTKPVAGIMQKVQVFMAFDASAIVHILRG